MAAGITHTRDPTTHISETPAVYDRTTVSFQDMQTYPQANCLQANGYIIIHIISSLFHNTITALIEELTSQPTKLKVLWSLS